MYSITMIEGSSNSNAGGNLLLISDPGSDNGDASNLIGGSGGSGFSHSTNIASSSSTDTSFGSTNIKTDNARTDTGRLSGDLLFSTSSNTSTNSSFTSIVSRHESAGAGGSIAVLV